MPRVLTPFRVKPPQLTVMAGSVVEMTPLLQARDVWGTDAPYGNVTWRIDSGGARSGSSDACGPSSSTKAEVRPAVSKSASSKVKSSKDGISAGYDCNDSGACQPKAAREARCWA